MSQQPWKPVVQELCERHPTRWLLVLAAVIYLPWLATEPVATSLEGLRLVPAREMLATGDWVVPRLNGDPYLAKPPLVYWAIAALSLPMGGVTELSGRLVSVLCMAATMLLVAGFGRRHLGARAGFLAAVISGFSVLAFEKGSRAELEAMLLVTTTGGLLALYQACRATSRRLAWTLLAGLGIGLAVLTKGPVPLLAFAAAGAALVLASDARRRTLGTLGIALTMALLVCLPWALALSMRFEPGELSRVLDVELFRRVEAADSVNQEPLGYYVVALLRGMLPWTLLFPGLVIVAGPGATVGKRPLVWFLAGWAVLTLLLLSFSSGKETRYLLPTYPAWGLLVAWGWTERQRLPGLPAYGRLLLRALLLAAWILPFALPVIAHQVNPDLLPAGLALGAAMLVGRLVISMGIRRGSALQAIAGILLALLALRGAWGELYWPTRASGYPYREIGAGVAERVAPGEPLLALGRISASLQFNIDRPLLRVKSAADLPRCRAEARCAGGHLLADEPVDTIPTREIANWPTKRKTFRLYALEPTAPRSDDTSTGGDARVESP